ncbi:hypothetical protein ANN_11186 [Periplaneta americana]|uniref:Uncharacterized protein n=1 Tax=Periplaneta americana TaxID=6978 RepID=A0ABQ8T5Q6_PERAM|nr:hypothetical protein ANN_11186 [Periplaneta americana]
MLIVLVGRPEGKRSLERLKRRWKDNIKTDLKEIEYDARDWINLAQDRDRLRAYVIRYLVKPNAFVVVAHSKNLMVEVWTPKKILNWSPLGRRKKRRLRLTWREGAVEDMRARGLKDGSWDDRNRLKRGIEDNR